MKYRFKHVVEYGLLRSLAGLLGLLPYRVSLGIGWCLAFIAFHMVRFRRKETVRRIQQVLGPQTTAAQARRIAWLSLRNVCFNAVELIHMRNMDRAWLDRYIDITHATTLLTAHDPEEGAVLAMVHLGNWELAGVAATHLGIPVFAIARTQSNPLTDRFLNRLRDEDGMDVLAREDRSLLREVLRRLRQKKMLGILMDLRAATPALDIEYLGYPANLAGGMALFARQSRVPVYPVVITRVGWCHHVVRVGDPVRPDLSCEKQEDWHRMTQAVMTTLGDAVMANPELYFWYNKRWVLEPLH